MSGRIESTLLGMVGSVDLSSSQQSRWVILIGQHRFGRSGLVGWDKYVGLLRVGPIVSRVVVGSVGLGKFRLTTLYWIWSAGPTFLRYFHQQTQNPGKSGFGWKESSFHLFGPLNLSVSFKFVWGKLSRQQIRGKLPKRPLTTRGSHTTFHRTTTCCAYYHSRYHRLPILTFIALVKALRNTIWSSL